MIYYEERGEPWRVDLPDPTKPTPPIPASDCDRCGYWERKRQLAEAAGDPSGAIDCRIELRRHKLRHHS